MLVGIARPDERSAGPVRGARDLADEGRILNLRQHDHELPRLHVDPDPNRQLGHTRQTFGGVVHRWPPPYHWQVAASGEGIVAGG